MKVEANILSSGCPHPMEKSSPSFITKQQERCRGRKHLAAEVLIQLGVRRGAGSGESLTLPKSPGPPTSPTPKGTFQGSFHGAFGSLGLDGPLPVGEHHFRLLVSLLLPWRSSSVPLLLSPPPYLSDGALFQMLPPFVVFSFHLLPSCHLHLPISSEPVSVRRPEAGSGFPHPVPPASPPGAPIPSVAQAPDLVFIVDFSLSLSSSALHASASPRGSLPPNVSTLSCPLLCPVLQGATVCCRDSCTTS